MVQEPNSRARSHDSAPAPQVDREMNKRWRHNNVPAGLVESENSIRRHISWIRKDMTALEDRLSVKSVRGVLRFAANKFELLEL